MKHTGTLTNAVTKPAKYDKEGRKTVEGFLAVTLKFDLTDFTDSELGSLLLELARGKEVEVDIESTQLLMEFADGVEPVGEDASA